MAEQRLPVDIQRAVTLTTSTTVNATTTPVAGTGFTLVTAATTNATSVKASSAALFEVSISNVTATAANATLTFEFGALGKRLATGLAYAVTGAAVATDTTAAVAGIQIHGTYV